MKHNRKEWVSLLLCLYALLTATALVTLPRRIDHIEKERTQPAGATASAPLALPDELQERLKSNAEASQEALPEHEPETGTTDIQNDAPQDDNGKKTT